MDATTGNFLDIAWFVQYWSSSSQINISPWRYCKTKEKTWTGQNTGGKVTLNWKSASSHMFGFYEVVLNTDGDSDTSDDDFILIKGIVLMLLNQ